MATVPVEGKMSFFQKPNPAIFFVTIVLFASVCRGQAPAQQAPVKIWEGSIGAGFSLTTGNSDTKNFNWSFDLTRDPKTRNLIKISSLYLWGSDSGNTNVDKLDIKFRDEYTLSDKLFFFASAMYYRDIPKEIQSQINPVGGLGYHLKKSETLQLSVGGGAGGIWEKPPDGDWNSSGTLNAGQELSAQLTKTAQLTQSVSGLWKTADFGDAQYRFAVALATAITEKAQLKAEFRLDYHTEPPSADIDKNDTATILSFIYNF
jgi:putative salt-induced outer membrane protein YdiY